MKVWVFDQVFWPKHGDRLLFPYPGRLWDSDIGIKQYHGHLEYLKRADELGFDGVCLTEHHYTVHGTPSPNVMAAAVAVQTQKVKLVILGNCVPLHAHPVRLAEELAMVDILSRGRLVSGFLRGGFLEWYAYNIETGEVRERFEEAWDLITEAWTAKEPFAWNGKHYHYENVSIMPRPVQQPHPPLIMAAATAESIEWCARKHIPIASSFAPTESMAENFTYYRDFAKKECGWSPGPESIMFSRQLYVAPTDQQARDEISPYIKEFFEEIPVTRKYPEQIEKFRAASRTERSFAYKQGKSAGAQFLGETMGGKFNLDHIIDQGLCIIGDPDSVTQQIRSQQKALGAGTMMIYAPFATMPLDMATRSLELFAREVLPNLRD
ncbi:MAG TPA: LLM class flavin-dependent oxidoreductase [Candidatus Binatia bacterium]